MAIEKRALTVSVPATQICDVCEQKPGAEHHFLTVPVPKGFTRVCDDHWVLIKRKIRERVESIVKEVFREVREIALRETL